jgi:putative ABC transport system permease protein
MNYFKLAWRNIWRNKKRTMITVSSIFFALFLALLMRGLQLGTYDQMIKNSVEYYTGYIQIHEKGYFDEPVLDNSFLPSDSLYNLVVSHPNVKSLLPRIESFALASSGEITKGGIVMGIDAVNDNKLTQLEDKLVDGRLPEKKEHGIVLAQKLAEYLKLEIGDTVVLLGQGYHGISAAGKYNVVGILFFPVPNLNNSLMYLDVETASELYSTEARLTSWVVLLSDNDKYEKTTVELQNMVPKNIEVLNWETFSPEVKQGIDADDASGQIILMILYIIIGFGIFGTVLMMIAERKKEFAIMVAVGMQKTKLAIVVIIETLLIIAIGLISSIGVSIPIIYYLHLNPLKFGGELESMFETYGMEPIMPMAWETSYFINQTIIVIVLAFIAIAYPLFNVFKFSVIKALRK